MYEGTGQACERPQQEICPHLHNPATKKARKNGQRPARGCGSKHRHRGLFLEATAVTKVVGGTEQMTIVLSSRQMDYMIIAHKPQQPVAAVAAATNLYRQSYPQG